MKSAGHEDVDDAIFRRIAKLKQQKDRLDALHSALSIKMCWFEEQAEIYEKMKQMVEFTYTSKI